jgi:hypothetical protein
MARPTRIDCPGAWYHVLNRSIEKRSIFRSQRCYESVRAVTKVWDRSWEQLLHARGCGARETALFIGRTRARLTLKELGSLAGSLNHNAVSIAIRRFGLRLQKDRALQRKLALVEKALNRI